MINYIISNTFYVGFTAKVLSFLKKLGISLPAEVPKYFLILFLNFRLLCTDFY